MVDIYKTSTLVNESLVHWLPEVYARYRVVGTMKRVVRIGGGSSGYTVLRGLKKFPLQITAIVNMFDSGGSSGVLRDEFGILPPGDVRRALAALADGEHSEILRELFNFRFNTGGSVNGHSFGNLFLTALASIYGSDIEAIRKASEVLHVSGKVLPISLGKADIHALLEDGTEIIGETNIDVPKHNGELQVRKVFLSPSVSVFEEAADEIRAADIIVLGPGDLYTSIIPNLLVEGVSDALRESKAKMVVVCNLMTKWGETHGFAASDMLRELLAYSGLEKFDVAICNTKKPSEELVRAYEVEKKHPMVCDEAVAQYAQEVVTGDFYSESDIARHDADKLAEVIANL